MSEGGRHFKTPGKNGGDTANHRPIRSVQPVVYRRAPGVDASPDPVRAQSQSPYQKQSRRPRRRKRLILPVIFIVVGVALLLAAGGLFIKAQLGYQEAKQAYDSLEQYAVADDSGDGVPTVNFDELAKVNPDVVGWIYVPGTVINYPVVQTDNNSTYLTRMFNGVNNGNGAIFMDMDDTAPGLVDQQTTLYGHHMNDNSMFNLIDKSRDQATFDTVKTVYYITRDATYTFKPIFTAPIQDDYADARTPNFSDAEALKQYVRTTYGKASAKAGNATELIDQSDQVLSLVTCAWGLIPDSSRAIMTCALVETTARE